MASPAVVRPPVKGIPPRRRFMADGDATPASLYSPISFPQTTNPIGYNGTSDPVAATVNQRQWTAGAGDALQSNDENLAQQYANQSQGTQNYLNPIEQNLASGGGGYSPTEASQINLTPEQQQGIVTGAGISAGAGTASSVGAAERAGAAAGGSPAATAAYRARAAQTEGAQAGDAMTQARIGAQQAGSAGAQAVGNARMNQQQQGSQYLGNLQSQQSTASQNEQGLTQGAYGTQTNATGAATGQQVAATTLPTIADKLIGAGAGALGGLLADGKKGTADYFDDDDGMDAVVGEAGPEVIVEAAPHMADGGTLDPMSSIPLLKAISGGMAGYAQHGQPGVPGAAVSTWNKATPWMQAGTAAGKLVKHFMAPKPAASPYKNTAADSTGTYTMPGGTPTPVSGGPSPMATGGGEDEMQGSASYLADGIGNELSNGLDDNNGDDSDKKNPDGSPKAGTPKVTNPEQSIRNYLSGAMANALRPPTPDEQYSLAWGAPKIVIPTAGSSGGGTTPKGTAINSNTSIDPPPVEPTPKGTAINSNTSIDPPPADPVPVATTSWPPPGGNAAPPAPKSLPVTTSWPPPSPPPATNTGSDESIKFDWPGTSVQPLPSGNGPLVGRPSGIVLPPNNPQAVPSTPNGSDSSLIPGSPIDTGPPPTNPNSGLNPQLPDLPDTPIPPPPDAGTGVDSTVNYAGGGPDQSNLQPVDLPPDSGVDPWGTEPGVGDELGYMDTRLPEQAAPAANQLTASLPFDDGSISGWGGGQDLNLGDSANPDEWDADGRVGNGKYMANGGMAPAFRWSERQPHQNRAPAGGYTPMNFRARPQPAPHMANGGMAPGTKIVTSPTRVKLAPGDQVVPLSYRPKAKIRPSAAVPSLFRARPGMGA